MHEAVLVHPDVDKGAKGRDIGDDALQDHAGPQIRKFFDAFLKSRGLENWARARDRVSLIPRAHRSPWAEPKVSSTKCIGFETA